MSDASQSAHAAHAADYNPQPLLVLDDEGVVRYANRAALTELGYEASGLLGRPLAGVLDEGSRAKGRAMLRAALVGADEGHEGHEGHAEAPPVYEINVVRGDEGITMMGFRTARIADPQGGILLIGQALAPAVATTERLVALNRQLNALLETASAASRSLVLGQVLDRVLGVALVELDLRAGAILLSGPEDRASARPTDRQPPSRAVLQPVAYRGISAAFAARLGDLAYQDRLRAMADARMRAMERTGEASQPAAPHADAPGAGRGRTAHDAGADADHLVVDGSADELGIEPGDLPDSAGPLLALVSVPIRGEGRPLGRLVLIADRYRAFGPRERETLRAIGDLLGPPIENARLYSALLERSGQLRTVLESIDSGVVLIDREGIIRYTNGPLGALLGADVAAWVGQPRSRAMTLQLRPVTETDSVFAGDLLELTEGPRRVLHHTVDTVEDAAGTPLGTIEVYGDVTAAYESDQLKDQFVAAAAHDLKTPLTAIRGYAQLALRLARPLDEPRLTGQLDMIRARGEELMYLMDSLLDMSRIQGGRLRLDLASFALDEALDKVVRYFDFDLQRQGRSVEIDLAPASLRVVWDRARVERILINLIGNAIKYSPDGGAVSVRVRRDAGSDRDIVRMAVTDRGIGIPPEERERIFERFYRSRETIDAGFRGTGIGLYTTGEIVAAHGGRIWAGDALHGGRGATMHVVMPADASTPEGDAGHLWPEMA